MRSILADWEGLGGRGGGGRVLLEGCPLFSALTSPNGGEDPPPGSAGSNHTILIQLPSDWGGTERREGEPLWAAPGPADLPPGTIRRVSHTPLRRREFVRRSFHK